MTAVHNDMHTGEQFRFNVLGVCLRLAFCVFFSVFHLDYFVLMSLFLLC